MPQSTQFLEDSNRPKLFGWKVINTYQIVDFAFIQTTDGNFSHRYHIYRSGHHTGYHESTLEMALITAIAHKYDGENSQAAHYFGRMIGLKED